MTYEELQTYNNKLKSLAINVIGAYEDKHTSEVDTYRAIQMLKEFLGLSDETN